MFFRQFHITGDAATWHIFRDYVHFYEIGTAALRRDAAALYDIKKLMAFAAERVPDAIDVYFPPVYGPQVAMFFAPLARLEYLPSLTTWLVLSIAVSIACSYAVWRVCPRLRSRAWPFFVVAAGFPGFHYNFMYGQAAALGLACFTAAFLALGAKREFLAGVAIGLLFYKPQLGVASAVVFVAAGQWRVVAGAAVSVAAQLLVAVLFWPPHVLWDYAGALRNLPAVVASMEPEKQHLHAWRPFLELLGVSGWPLVAGTLGLSLATLAAAVVSWRSAAPLPVRFAVLLLATVLVNPHMFAYDLAILAVALAVLWDVAAQPLEQAVSPRSVLALRLLLVALYITPLLEFVTVATHLQLSVLTMAGLAAVALSKVSETKTPTVLS